MIDMTEELTNHYLSKHNWAGLSIEKLSKRYNCEMNTVWMTMAQIAQKHKRSPKQSEKEDKSLCASPRCGMKIMWIKTVAEKNMCVDPGGGVIIDPKTGEVVRGFVPHWVTCKDPDFFRKKKAETS